MFEKPFSNALDTAYIVPSYSEASINQVLGLKGIPRVFLALGIAPQEIAFGKFQIGRFDSVAKFISDNREFIAAIGEIGLDFHYAKPEHVGIMRSLFERQLSLAERLCLPVVVHSRKAEAVMPEVLGSYKVKGIMHAFGGTAEQAKAMVELGFKISIPPLRSKHRKSIIQKLELSDLLIETDYPYIAKKPEDLEIAAAMIAEYKEIEIAAVYSATLENFMGVIDKCTK